MSHARLVIMVKACSEFVPATTRVARGAERLGDAFLSKVRLQLWEQMRRPSALQDKVAEV